MTVESYIVSIVFIFIHLLADRLIPADRMKRNRWLSFSGGLAVSYVFIYVLPSLHERQESLEGHLRHFSMASELYVFSLLGLLLFYGIQTAVDDLKQKRSKEAAPFFWVQVVFFAIYNMLIAFIIVSAEMEGGQAVFYGVAIGFHFVAVAHELYQENPKKYQSKGRYVVASGMVLGSVIGLTLTVPSFIQSIITAFISGAMIMNVLKHEIPHEKEAHFPAFAIGVIVYMCLTLSLKLLITW